MSEKVDALRVVQEPAYAASLTEEQWHGLALDPAWDELVGEHHEMVAPVLALYAQNLGVPAPQVVRTSAPAPARPAVEPAVADTAETFQVIGKRVPRLHGLGIVTNLGQYVENMRMPGMLHTRTLRSPHPHATVKSVDISKAQALSGVVHILHRGNLPPEYRDVRLGSAPPERFLFN